MDSRDRPKSDSKTNGKSSKRGVTPLKSTGPSPLAREVDDLRTEVLKMGDRIRLLERELSSERSLEPFTNVIEQIRDAIQRLSEGKKPFPIDPLCTECGAGEDE